MNRLILLAAALGFALATTSAVHAANAAEPGRDMTCRGTFYNGMIMPNDLSENATKGICYLRENSTQEIVSAACASEQPL
jgi:hypothetical protein